MNALIGTDWGGINYVIAVTTKERLTDLEINEAIELWFKRNQVRLDLERADMGFEDIELVDVDTI